MWLCFNMFCVNVLYTIAGIAAFITFLILQYYPAAIFGFVTATISGVTSHILWLHKKRRLTVWYETHELSQLFWLGFWTSAIGCSGLVYNIVLLVATPGPKWQIGLIVNCIWGFIAVKCGCLLMYYANKFSKEHPNIIINDVNTNSVESPSSS